MAEPNVLLSHLRDYLGEKILPEGQREELIRRQGAYFDRLAKKNLTESEVHQVKYLINIVESYPFDHAHLCNLIEIFRNDIPHSTRLFNTLHNPSLDNLSNLLDIAKGYDQAYRDKNGSNGRLFSEVLDTCVAAVGAILKGLFLVIALPMALGVGAVLSLKFEKAKLLDPAFGYISWLAYSFDEINKHAKNVELEYSKLTYDLTTQSAESTRHAFFSKKTDGAAVHAVGEQSSLSLS